jgi:hypothetical protein
MLDCLMLEGVFFTVGKGARNNNINMQGADKSCTFKLCFQFLFDEGLSNHLQYIIQV